MTANRLTLALDAGAFAVPDDGRIAVFRPRADHDLSALPKDRVDIIQGFRPDHDAWVARGYDASAVAARSDYALSIVMLPRAKAEARAVIAEAASRTEGALIVDGQKTDGIDSFWRDCRKRADVTGTFSKAHGKTFAINNPAGFDDWAAGPTEGPEGFITAPGVFSAAKVDKGSRLLVEAMEGPLSGNVADLGAGWGYLSHHLAQHDGIKTLHLIEAEHAALECARLNIIDPRAEFHWADATRFQPTDPFDVVVTNPPFHTGRAGDPSLGRAFIAAAAKMLTPRGTLWVVANRHLPYEAELSDLFRNVEEIGGDSGFKVLKAALPKRSPRTKI